MRWSRCPTTKRRAHTSILVSSLRSRCPRYDCGPPGWSPTLPPPRTAEGIGGPSQEACRCARGGACRGEGCAYGGEVGACGSRGASSSPRGRTTRTDVCVVRPAQHRISCMALFYGLLSQLAVGHSRTAPHCCGSTGYLTSRIPL
jgi:hypothetical protein